MEVILFIGVPASGKSTFYRDRFAATHLRINRDMLGTKHRQESLFRWCLDHGQSCVVDNTNSTRDVRRPWIGGAQERGAKLTGYFFQSKITDCLARNRQRSGRARIPDAGVLGHHAQLELPSAEEGFEALYHVSIAENGFIVNPWTHEI